jgi:hypothetical protein
MNPPKLTEMLLNRWLCLSEEGRKEEFVNTARAAQIAGMAQRTIQHWIETRNIAAVPIGRRHEVHLISLRNISSCVPIPGQSEDRGFDERSPQGRHSRISRHWRI